MFICKSLAYRCEMNERLKENLNAPSPEIISRLAQIVGRKDALTDPDQQARYLVEWRDRYFGRSPLVLRPSTTTQVSEILKLANQERIGVVPQGGNTGLVGGQIPFETGTEIVIATEKLNKVRFIDPAGHYATVEAGLTLSQIQNIAEDHNRLFPLSLASEGTCQIGGNLATNAGGINVLAYGSARNLVHGLEVVLANGQVWDGLSALQKDNTGYNLKDLFIGSEGTLGLITAATLKLFPRPKDQTTSFIALSNLNNMRAFFELAEKAFDTSMTAFEFLPHRAIEYVIKHVPGTQTPFAKNHHWYVLLELSANSEYAHHDKLESFLSEALDANLIDEATIASSLEKRKALWRLREEISSAQKPEGGSIKHDISVPVSMIPEFISRANKISTDMCPGVRPLPFGHFGDGNIHFNLSQPTDMDREKFLSLWEPISRAIHDLTADMGGSFSAEHGIGRMKRDDLIRYKSHEEITLMRTIKSALDPNGILNPGKLL